MLRDPATALDDVVREALALGAETYLRGGGDPATGTGPRPDWGGVADRLAHSAWAMVRQGRMAEDHLGALCDEADRMADQRLSAEDGVSLDAMLSRGVELATLAEFIGDGEIGAGDPDVHEFGGILYGLMWETAVILLGEERADRLIADAATVAAARADLLGVPLT